MGADDGNESPDESPGGVARRDAGAPIDPATLGGWFDAYGAALVLYARQWLDAWLRPLDVRSYSG